MPNGRSKPETGYSAARLDELCRLVREHRPVSSESHVRQLVTVDWPGRDEQPGQRIGETRTPIPATADQHAPVPAMCPPCGHDQFDHVEPVEEYQDDLPRQPIRRTIFIRTGTCGTCRRSVHGRHPVQLSDATRACASHVGPEAQAAVVHLNDHAGLSYATISVASDKLHGLTLSRGAYWQIVLRAADRLTQPSPSSTTY